MFKHFCDRYGNRRILQKLVEKTGTMETDFRRRSSGYE